MSTIKDTDFTEFSLSQDAYAAFDATTLRDLIINRLTESDVFTDQIFEGSNISSIIDIVAYSYHVLLFYLNKTSTESLFTDTQIYENMNRIVKLINYKPTGYQTSVLSFKTTCSNVLPINTYTIPRYTYIDVDGIRFLTKNDITFSKVTTDDNETISSIGDNNLLYQGTVIESPGINASGIPFETITLKTQSKSIDTNTISVFVQDATTGTYSEYTQVESLFLHSQAAKVFEKRYNENGDYELKFGNDVTGKKLNTNDTVCIYYIESDGEAGVIGKDAINTSKFILFATSKFNSILNDTKSEFIKYMNTSELQSISLTNTNRSTTPKDRETTEEIRTNAPISFQSQDRLITSNDFKHRISKKFGNLLTDIHVQNNTEYINTYLKYFNDTLGVDNPRLESRALLNNAYFSSTTNFNNVYTYCVPRLENKTSANIQSNFLTISQKTSIKRLVEQDKVITSEVVFTDPVYVAVDLLPSTTDNNVDLDNVSQSRLIIYKNSGSQVSDDSLKQQVNNAIISHFKFTDCRLGQVIDISTLAQNILGISGVTGIATGLAEGIQVPGLSLVVWNPVYPIDTIVTNQNIQLPVFKFPYLYNEGSLLSKIVIKTQ